MYCIERSEKSVQHQLLYSVHYSRFRKNTFRFISNHFAYEIFKFRRFPSAGALEHVTAQRSVHIEFKSILNSFIPESVHYMDDQKRTLLS